MSNVMGFVNREAELAEEAIYWSSSNMAGGARSEAPATPFRVEGLNINRDCRVVPKGLLAMTKGGSEGGYVGG
ncbi:MAG: hypothetical protein ACYSYT_08040, partial [Planctomycetota bacterium]|jgi:hypothetical protein